MLVDSENGEAHVLCYLLDRFTMHPAEDECTAALRWQGLQDRLEVSQFVARMQCFFSRVVGLKHVEFRDQLQRNDLFSSRLVNQQVAGDLIQECLAGLAALNVAIGIGSRHAFSDDIVDIGTTGNNPAEAGPQSAFVRKDSFLEPVQSCSD